MGVIAVGVDGSDQSLPALEWAAQEAAAHGHTLRVVTAWSPEPCIQKFGNMVARSVPTSCSG